MNEEHQNLIAQIEAATQGLQAAVARTPAELADLRPEEGEWSVVETLLHTRNVAMLAYGLRLRRILAEANPVFPDYDEESPLMAVLKQSRPPNELLAMIVAEHQQIVGLLSALPDDNWVRTGSHPRYGELSIAYLARRIAEHAVEHTGQINDTLDVILA